MIRNLKNLMTRFSVSFEVHRVLEWCRNVIKVIRNFLLWFVLMIMVVFKGSVDVVIFERSMNG